MAELILIRSSRFQWIDLLKGIGILLIVFCHSRFPLVGISYSLVGYIAMPLFFFLSGYLFDYDKYKNSVYAFINKRINRLLLPFFVTYFFAIIVFYISNEISKHVLGHTVKISSSISDAIIAMFYGNATPNNAGFLDGPLWFLLCLFCGNMILYIYVMYMDSKNGFLGIISCMVIAFIGYLISRTIFLPWGLDIALVSLAFMYLGFLAKKHSIFDQMHDKFQIYAIIFSTSLFFFVIYINYHFVDINARIYGNLFLFFLGSFLGIGLSVIAAKTIQRCSRIKIFLTFFGMNSMPILVFHMFWIDYIKTAISIIEPQYYFIFDNWVVTFLLMIVTSLVMIYVFKKIKLLGKIYNI